MWPICAFNLYLMGRRRRDFHAWEIQGRLLVKLHVWATSPQWRPSSREKFQNMLSCQKENPQSHASNAWARKGQGHLGFNHRKWTVIVGCDGGWVWDEMPRMVGRYLGQRAMSSFQSPSAWWPGAICFSLEVELGAWFPQWLNEESCGDSETLQPFGIAHPDTGNYPYHIFIIYFLILYVAQWSFIHLVPV